MTGAGLWLPSEPEMLQAEHRVAFGHRATLGMAPVGHRLSQSGPHSQSLICRLLSRLATEGWVARLTPPLVEFRSAPHLGPVAAGWGETTVPSLGQGSSHRSVILAQRQVLSYLDGLRQSGPSPPDTEPGCWTSVGYLSIWSLNTGAQGRRKGVSRGMGKRMGPWAPVGLLKGM